MRRLAGHFAALVLLVSVSPIVAQQRAPQPVVKKSAEAPAPVASDREANFVNPKQTAIVVTRHMERDAAERIQKALDETTSFDFVETPLSDVVTYLNSQHKIEIKLDMKALEDMSVGPDQAVTYNVKGISLRSALELMLGAMDLTYMIKDEVLLITTFEVADSELATKIYLVDDLVSHPSPEGMRKDFSNLKETIIEIIAPTTWDEVGGPASIMAFDNAGALVVSQTSDVHDEIAMLLESLRQARDKQGVKPTVYQPKPQPTQVKKPGDKPAADALSDQKSSEAGIPVQGGQGGGQF